MINFPLTIPFLLYTRPRTLLAIDCVAIPLMGIAYRMAIPIKGAAAAAIITSTFGIARVILYQAIAWRLLRDDPSGAIWSRTASISSPFALAGSAS